ncbi:MAG TPA: carbohydrate ABC transporter permease [Thermomicrobiales bacterium]|jgi:ABC-type glycerol-3-phosphate transport system permease component
MAQLIGSAASSQSRAAEEVAGARGRGRRDGIAVRLSAFAAVVLLAVLFLLPVYWMVITSLKSLDEVFHDPLVWWPRTLVWHNYSDALDAFPFWRYLRNTATIAIPVAIGTTISSAFVAYAFSRLRWRGRDAVFYLILGTLMIPNWVTLVPLYILFNRMGWVNTYKPLIVPAFFGDPFSIFLLRQFFLRQPQELVDAARVDGASHLRVFLQIILPLSRPALAVVALFSFINAWTDFFNPLIYLSDPNKFTLQIGLFNFFGLHTVNWPGFMAASVVILAPIALLFIVAQRVFIEGITFTGLRG